MDRKQSPKVSSKHSFDMSEYIYGERFVLGGIDFDLDDETTPPAKNSRQEKDSREEQPKKFFRGPEVHG